LSVAVPYSGLQRRQQPPTRPRFPYTTLFRSTARPPPNSVVSPYTSLDEPTAGNTERGTPNSFSSSSSQSPVRTLKSIVRDALLGDRKSTRLNSSHLGISYAVLCLKKKNT